MADENVLSDAIVNTMLHVYVWHNKWGIHSSSTDIEALADRNVLSDVIVDTMLYVWHSEWAIPSCGTSINRSNDNWECFI